MNLFASILISIILALFAYYKKSLSFSATIVACVFSILIAYFGGLVSFLILLFTFLITVVAGKISEEKRNIIIKSINQKHGRRDMLQVISNVGVATLSIIIYYFNENDIFLIAYACVMASSLADTVGSEIGVLSKKSPVDILTFKDTVKGISGGVTVLGLLSSILSSFIIAVTYSMVTESNISILVLILIMGFLGSLIDSILGSLIQVKYKCVKCRRITERKEHCNIRTDYYKGIKFINNDIVNLLNNISIFLISAIFSCFFH